MRGGHSLQVSCSYALKKIPAGRMSQRLANNVKSSNANGLRISGWGIESKRQLKPKPAYISISISVRRPRLHLRATILLSLVLPESSMAIWNRMLPQDRTRTRISTHGDVADVIKETAVPAARPGGTCVAVLPLALAPPLLTHESPSSFVPLLTLLILIQLRSSRPGSTTYLLVSLDVRRSDDRRRTHSGLSYTHA